MASAPEDAPPACADKVCADDLVFAVIGALDQHVRLEFADDFERLHRADDAGEDDGY